MRKAVLAGGSGFVGSRLAADLTAAGYHLVRVGRRGPDVRWGEAERLVEAVDGADLVINLAGRSVGCRYTDRRRNEIYDSRIETTAALREAIAASADPPSLWMNASTGTIYRYALDRPQSEYDGELGCGFSVDVARDWEREFFAADLPRTRRVALRMAIVLGDGSALTLLRRAARFGAGGPQYDGWWFPHARYRGIGPTPTKASTTGHRSGGRQRFSWVHLDDLSAAVQFLIEHEEISGPVNVSAPGVSTNRELMAQLRRAIGMPIGLPAPRWLLEIGMLVLRQESELVLKSRWVQSGKLLDAGFSYRWPDLGPAVDDLVR